MATKKTSPKTKKASTPKTSKPAAKKPEFGAKTAFIKSQPTSMTAKEVVAAAKSEGITLSENLVYAARAGTKKKGPKKAKGATNAKKPGPKPEAAGPKAGGSLEATLRNAIAELGLARARVVFEAVEKAFKG
jgi:hypothetical protein